MNRWDWVAVVGWFLFFCWQCSEPPATYHKCTTDIECCTAYGDC